MKKGFPRTPSQKLFDREGFGVGAVFVILVRLFVRLTLRNGAEPFFFMPLCKGNLTIQERYVIIEL